MSVDFFIMVLASGVASVFLGWIWYHPSVFGGSWMRMANVTPEMAERGKKRMPLFAFVALLASMLVAFVMSYIGILLNIHDWLGAVELGFWCWIGFVAPTMLGMVLWEHKPFRYYCIVAGYWLVSFIVMALIFVEASQLLSSAEPYHPSGIYDEYGNEYQGAGME